MKMLNIEITPQREALLKGFDNEFHALLRVNADEVPLKTYNQGLFLSTLIIFGIIINSKRNIEYCLLLIPFGFIFITLSFINIYLVK